MLPTCQIPLMLRPQLSYQQNGNKARDCQVAGDLRSKCLSHPASPLPGLFLPFPSMEAQHQPLRYTRTMPEFSVSRGQRLDGPGWGMLEGGRGSAGAGRLDPGARGEEVDEVTPLGCCPRPSSCAPPTVLLRPHPIPGGPPPSWLHNTPVSSSQVQARPARPAPRKTGQGAPTQGSLRGPERAEALEVTQRRAALPVAEAQRRRTPLQAPLCSPALHSRLKHPGRPGFRHRPAANPRAELERVCPKRGQVCPVWEGSERGRPGACGQS